MRGIGGPLLYISDLLSDVGEDSSATIHDQSPPSATAVSDLPPAQLPKLFQERFGELNTALEGSDHSWTGLTLKLCSALETANRLIDSTNSHVATLSEKVEELQRSVDRRDSAVNAAKAIQADLPKP